MMEEAEGSRRVQMAQAPVSSHVVML
jgi:hypothetical protein